jgi:hypothetical protein
MSRPSLAHDPQLTSRTVFFIGNGVLRVAAGNAGHHQDRPFRSPSWAEYMDNLWSFIRLSPESPGYLSLADFSRLPAPRQAEWFDREFRELYGAGIDIAALRLHLLGRVIHPDDRIVSNPLFRLLADLIAGSAAEAPSTRELDVITTNVDCALEQNLARVLERLAGLGRGGQPAEAGEAAPLVRATIETIVDFRVSARWELRTHGSGRGLTIRLWKLHGCLRDLKIQLADQTEMTRTVLEAAGDTQTGLCGHVPTDKLAASLLGEWRQTHDPGSRPRPHSGVFTQSEYFRNLLLLARSEPQVDSPAADDGEQGYWLSEFREMLAGRPLIFVGYSIPDVDVDIVYALQRYRPRDDHVRRWQLLADRERSASTEERLRQLGVDPWPFGVSALGFAAIPGKLRAARRHEWRSVTADPLDLHPERDWRRALERIAAQAWLEPQLRALASLGRSRPPHPAVAEHRLVVAGLASIWHAVALTNPADFPVRRRVSARLVSVDAQVPGGSGLVPVMVAAAAAGPAAVGHLAFFSNAPETWSSWDEIEDMCLSAGIAVHAWKPRPNQGEDELAAVARTSHAILFDPARKDSASRLPRQRFIMDVQALADEGLARQVTDWSALKVPAARLTESFQEVGQEDFLFVDKEAEPGVVARWQGPTVYETGASGDELVTRLRRAGVKPTIWTAGVGSYIRTLVALAGRVPPETVYDGGPQAVLDYLEQDDRLAALAGCGNLRERYLAKVVSFGRPGIWDFGGTEGFSYSDELDYGIWLQERWAELSGPTWDLLGDAADGVLASPHPQIGGGVLTTIHDGGLMALWRWPDGRTEHVSVRIGTTGHEEEDGFWAITVRCELTGANPLHSEPVIIQVRRDHMTFSAGGCDEVLPPSPPVRRSTLAAGDTVRGAMAYGLWTAAYRLPSSGSADIPRIFLASAALASLKCYAGSFVDFLRLIEQLRGTSVWKALWQWPN